MPPVLHPGHILGSISTLCGRIAPVELALIEGFCCKQFTGIGLACALSGQTCFYITGVLGGGVQEHVIDRDNVRAAPGGGGGVGGQDNV